MLPLAAVTEMLLTVVVLTVRVVLVLTLPEVAVMVVLPVLVVAVANPELLMVAIVGEEEDQVTVDVTSREVPSPKLPVAVNCCVLLGAIVGFEGVSETATSVFPETKNLPQPARNPKAISAALAP